MRYQVPQFIEVEDKIFGPLTLKQFIYLAGAGGIGLVFFTLFPTYFAVILTLPFAALSLALAFYRPNDRPLIEAIEHAVLYLMSRRLYLWKQPEPKSPALLEERKGEAPLIVPKINESKLTNLTWSLNIKERRQAGVREEKGFRL